MIARRAWWLGLLLPGLLGPALAPADSWGRALAFRLRGVRPPPPELVIVDVDEASVNLAERLAPAELAASPFWRRMGPWPWPRALQAELAALVLERGARRVVFTLVQARPSGFGPADDRAFRQRLAPWRQRLVLMAGYGSELDAAAGVELVQLRRPLYSLGSVGHDALLEGPAGWIEAIPGARWDAQALAALPLPHPPALAFAAAARRPTPASLGIDFPGPAGTVPVVPAWRLLEQPEGFWRDRIVLIGRTPSRLGDRRPSPFGPLSAVELQAAALATVLEGRGFRELPGPALPLLLLGWALLVARPLGHSATAAATARAALLLMLLALGLAAAAWLLAWWLPLSALLAMPLLAGGLRGGGQWRAESRERAYLHQVLAHRLSPALLADILRQPGPLGTRLGGSRCRCAVLFTDLVGFTPLSAQLPPAQLFSLLNRYFEVVAAAVIEQGGLLDKFIGDAVMAEFGVPRSRGEQQEALAALRAALAMGHGLERLNRELVVEGWPPLRQGIGIHVGEVIAGNLGSSQRLEFTVVGASVNLASRLEGLTRQFPDHPILISAAVVELLADQLPALLAGRAELVDLGAHQLRGWPESIGVYGLRPLP